MSASINSKFSVCQLPIRTNSKNKTEDLVYSISILVSRLAPILLHIIKHSSNVSFIRDRYRNPAIFQMECLVMKDIGFQHLTIV